MEMRRRRTSSGRQNYRRNAGGGSSWLRALLLLAVFGAIIYSVFGTGLGKKLKDVYAVPFYEKLTGKGAGSPREEPPEETPFAPAETPAPSPAPSGETMSLSLKGIDIYMLQLGVFDSAGDAAERADAVRTMGAAGYVYDDGECFRVIGAAYSDSASLESVQAKLRAEGTESTAFRISRGGVELVVTAAPERLLPVKTAFRLAEELAEQLDELAVEFDSESRSVEYGLTVLGEMQSNIVSASRGIEEPAKLNGMLSKVLDYLGEVRSAVSDARSASSDRTAFSSALKALRIRVSLGYAALLSAIGG